MAIDRDALLAHDFGLLRQRYGARDAILYALGVGLGHDPLDERDLAFLYEDDLRVLPSFAVTLASPGQWIRDPRFGVDFTRLVHLAQRATFHRPLPVAAEVMCRARVLSVSDRGEGRGAVLVLERTISEDGDSKPMAVPLATVRQTLLLRGDGGFGGPPAPRDRSVKPARPPDIEVDLVLSSRAALIYRLSGDLNPLHVDPAFARAAGFERPILHGLGTYGAASVALSRAVGTKPEHVASFDCRFSGVVFPGDTLHFLLWHDDGVWRFEAHSRGAAVLSDGLMVVGDV